MTAAGGFVTEPTGLTDRRRIFRLYARTTLVAGVVLTLFFALMLALAVLLWGPETGRTPPAILRAIPPWIVQGFGLTMIAPMTWLGLLAGWLCFRGREHLLMRPLVMVVATIILHAATILVFLLLFLAIGTGLGRDLRLVFPVEGLYATVQSGATYGLAVAALLRYRMRRLQKPDPAGLF